MSAAAIAVGRRVPRPAVAGLWVFATVAIALGAARAVTTTYVPVLLERSEAISRELGGASSGR